MNIRNRSAFYFNVPDNMKLVGDSAYVSQPHKVTTTKNAHSPASKRLFARMKSLLETCNGRLKNLKVVHDSFCHGQGLFALDKALVVN
jgi:hypothetical protein